MTAVLVCSGGGIAGDNGKPEQKVVMAVKVTPELKEMTDYLNGLY